MNSKTIIISKKKQKRKKSPSNNLCLLAPDIVLNKLYLNMEFDGSSQAKKNMQKKLNSYQSQDKKKNKFNSDTFITFTQLVEKMVASKMHCYYCRYKVKLFYDYVREPLQWTLDRLDNTQGHGNNNTVIACLKCNLERRTQNDKKFLFSKQMRIIKKIG